LCALVSQILGLFSCCAERRSPLLYGRQLANGYPEAARHVAHQDHLGREFARTDFTADARRGRQLVGNGCFPLAKGRVTTGAGAHHLKRPLAALSWHSTIK
jgi:hypothetical protein